MFVSEAFQVLNLVVESNKAMTANEQNFKKLTETCEELSKIRESIRKALQNKKDNEQEEKVKREQVERKKTDKEDMKREKNNSNSLNEYDPCYDIDEEGIPEFEYMFVLSDFFSGSNEACSIYGDDDDDDDDIVADDNILDSPKVTDETDKGRESKLKTASDVLKDAKGFLTEFERSSTATSTVSMTTSNGSVSSPGGKVEDGECSPSTTANENPTTTTTTTTTSLWDTSIFSFNWVTPTTDTSCIEPASVSKPDPPGLVDPGYVMMKHLIEQKRSIDGSPLDPADVMLKTGSWVIQKGFHLYSAKTDKSTFKYHQDQIDNSIKELNAMREFFGVDKATTDIKLEVSLVHEDIKKVIDLIKVREQNLNAVIISKSADPISPGKSGGRGLLGKIMNRAKDFKAGDSTRGDKMIEGIYDPLPHLHDYRGYSVYRQRGADSKEEALWLVHTFEMPNSEYSSYEGLWVVQSFEQMTTKSSECYAYVESGYALPQRCAGLPWNINIRGKFVSNMKFTMTVCESLLEIKLNDRVDKVKKFLQGTKRIQDESEAYRLLSFVCTGDTVENVAVVKKFVDSLLDYFTTIEEKSKDDLQDTCRFWSKYHEYLSMMLRVHKDNLTVVNSLLEVIVQIMVISAPASNQGYSVPDDSDTPISLVCDRLMQPNFNDMMKKVDRSLSNDDSEKTPTMKFAETSGFVDHLCDIFENLYIDYRCLEGENDRAAAAIQNAEAKRAEQDETNVDASESLTPDKKALGLASLGCMMNGFVCLACLMTQNSIEFPIIQYLCETRLMQYDFLRLSSFFSGDAMPGLILVRLAMSHIYRAMAHHDLSYLVDDVDNPNFLGLPDVCDTHFDILFELMDPKYTYHPTIISNEIHIFKFLTFVEKHMKGLSEDGLDVDFEIVDKSLQVLRLIALYSGTDIPIPGEEEETFDVDNMNNHMFNCHAMIAKTQGALDLLRTLVSQPAMKISSEDIACSYALQDEQIGSKCLRLKAAVGIAVSICLLFRQFETPDESMEWRTDPCLLESQVLTPEQHYGKSCRMVLRHFLRLNGLWMGGDESYDAKICESFGELSRFVEAFEAKHSSFAFPDPLKR